MALVEYVPPETMRMHVPKLAYKEMSHCPEIPKDEFREFSETVYALVRANRDQAAIAKVLDYFDSLLSDRKFFDCNQALRRLQVSLLPGSVLVSILGITIRARAMRARAAFYECALAKLSKEKGSKYAKELLSKYR